MPKFSLQVTPAVKEEGGWKVTALATVLYGNRAPEPPEEVVFDVNGEEFERSETDPDSGIARSAMLLQPGGYVITAYRSGARNDRGFVRFTVKEERKASCDEKKISALKAKTRLAEVDKEFKEAERQVKVLQPKRRIEVLGTESQTGVLKVFLCRFGKDGNPELGEIRAFDGSILSLTMKPDEEVVIASLELRDRPRKVVFFLPDDREVKTNPVEVPAKAVKREVATDKDETVKVSASQRIKEAFQRGLRGGE